MNHAEKLPGNFIAYVCMGIYRVSFNDGPYDERKKVEVSHVDLLGH